MNNEPINTSYHLSQILSVKCLAVEIVHKNRRITEKKEKKKPSSQRRCINDVNISLYVAADNNGYYQLINRHKANQHAWKPFLLDKIVNVRSSKLILGIFELENV